ncbi:hypothetical protein NQ314_021050, partial [Rhamnusium bicolor]
SFRREKAKARKTVGTGKGAKDVYKSDWFAFNSFAFLMDKNDPRETISSGKKNDDEAIEFSEMSESSEVIMANESTESQELLEGIEQNHESPEPSTPRRKRAKITEKEDPRIEKAFQFLQQPIPQEDSSTLFAKYLADRLDKFNPQTKAILIHKINQLIFEAEMEKYRMQSSSYAPGLLTLNSPSPATSVTCSPASTSPFFSEVLGSNNFAPEDTQSTNSHTSSDELVSDLGEFVYLTKL